MHPAGPAQLQSRWAAKALVLSKVPCNGKVQSMSPRAHANHTQSMA